MAHTSDAHNLRSGFPNVAFGTSGVRALVADLTAEAVAAYVLAFVRRMRETGGFRSGNAVAVAMDLRPSSPAIVQVICTTLSSEGLEAVFLGPLPTPALALHCLTATMPGIMVTGSHIPFDRNGIKFYGPAGEISKDDEQAMVEAAMPVISAPAPVTGVAESLLAGQAYIRRYIDYFGRTALTGLRIGLYQHSAVGRDMAGLILGELGATVIPLGRSDVFVPIDTEAVGDADLEQARQWCGQHRLDALLSTDGDGDRPLVFDANGNFVTGDLLGLLCARMLGIRALAVPVSCNTAIEQSGVFGRVLRTRIGSPYVIEGMEALLDAGEQSVAGFEANGGFLLATSLPGLHALPTRDAMLPMIAVLSAVRRGGRSLAALLAELPARFTHSDRLRDVPAAVSQPLLARLAGDTAFREGFYGNFGAVAGLNTVDGFRVTFAGGDIIHLRASGNAPELRCYAEAGTVEQARELCRMALEQVRQAVGL